MPPPHLFLCVPECGRSFNSENGLEKHQNACTVFSEPDMEFDDLPKLMQAEDERRKRRRVESAVNPVPITMPPVEVQGPVQQDPPEETAQPAPAPSSPALGRGKRVKRPTYKILEQLPQPPIPLDPPSEPVSSPVEAPARPSFVWQSIRSAMNVFGLYRDYPAQPSHSPDDTASLEDLVDASVRPQGPPADESSGAAALAPSTRAPWFPFANLSIFLLITWLFTGSNSKSIEEADRLVDVLRTPGFSVEDLSGFSAKRETTAFDDYLRSSASGPTPSPLPDLPTEDGWDTKDVPIEVPDGRPHRPGTDDPPIPVYPVPGLVFRSIRSLIVNVWSSPAARHFHFTPFRQLWQRTPDKVERVHGELFASDAFAQAHAEVQNLPAKDGCTLERVVCALMFWSDALHLANFGTASLWPIYLFFGNESKYRRSSIRSHSCHHVAYILKLPDKFFDWYETLTGGRKPSDDLLAHLRSQLMHAVWQLLLDDDFMDAYVNGIVIDHPAGGQVRVFPRLFTYSADYPEKVLLATVRNMGKCPCPRCTVPKEKIPDIGMQRDDARRTRDTRVDNHPFQYDAQTAYSAVYERGKPVRGADVQGVLDKHSYVPTKNAFSVLNIPGLVAFNLFSIFVVDLMHEFELGIFKQVFAQLVRILICVSDASVRTMNKRFRLVPTFGRGTIRRFTNDISQMKKLAARDWEDIMQCALPVLEGLFPGTFDSIVQDLVFTLCYWHALAKLRMHTDSTVALLRDATKQLGTTVRLWVKRSVVFPTRELPGEAKRRGKRRSKKTHSSSKSAPAPSVAPPPAKPKAFNLLTYKLHALGDYVSAILWFGTTDSYSTQRGELEHRRPKAFYARTNKNRAARQISQLELRERGLRRIAGRVIPTLQRRSTHIKNRRRARAVLDLDEADPLPMTPPEVHHHISHSQRYPVVLPLWLRECREDPLTTDFYGRLQDHILERLLDPDLATDDRRYSTEERMRVTIQSDRIYLHKVLRINYTTYDVRRAQDSLNPRTGAHIMTLARDWDDGEHPFSYARILGIIHVNVSLRSIQSTGPHTRPSSTQLKEVLWVRWFRHDPRWRSGFRSRRLPRIQFVAEDSEHAYGFLDPDDVIRAAHVVPAFAHGKDEDDEYLYHYVNIFVDRDMFMRYVGLGVGHSYTTSLPVHEVPAVNGGDRSSAADDEDSVEFSTDAAGGAVASDGESDASYSDGDGDDDSDDDAEGPGEDSEEAGEDELELWPEDGEDAAVYDLDNDYVGYDDP